MAQDKDNRYPAWLGGGENTPKQEGRWKGQQDRTIKSWIEVTINFTAKQGRGPRKRTNPMTFFIIRSKDVHGSGHKSHHIGKGGSKDTRGNRGIREGIVSLRKVAKTEDFCNQVTDQEEIAPNMSDRKRMATQKGKQMAEGRYQE